jgi:predicted transposase YdaD
MSGNMWIEFVKNYQVSHPKLSYKECMEKSKKPYQEMKQKQQGKQQGAQKQKQQKQQKRRGGASDIELSNPQMRFEAGVTALNSNLAGIGRAIVF